MVNTKRSEKDLANSQLTTNLWKRILRNRWEKSINQLKGYLNFIANSLQTYKIGNQS